VPLVRAFGDAGCTLAQNTSVLQSSISAFGAQHIDARSESTRKLNWTPQSPTSRYSNEVK